ncbi:hypothetical protein B0H63DRAFT_219990 [Podospora didyma]|uniref:Uncharacterized protein n=1 Tax=Podospora didyma TaxID=330526 RepID=A0AAE0KIR0_9PEZI|nr:hypothetical protein B0H63DRAFT_219990 [Podospora didyma]
MPTLQHPLGQPKKRHKQQTAMTLPCNLNVYITVEAVTLIGLTFVAATSLLINSAMAKKRKSSTSAKPPQTPLAAPKAAIEPLPKVADAPGPSQEEAAIVALPVMEEIDNRPETSPYASPPCTIPFSTPLTIPLDFLQKSPKLHAAYESRLPELPDIPEDIGHVLVHYLHTGTYEALKPKEAETPAKQLYELRTSIRAYATARAYDLPDLMRLAEVRIEKYGAGLTLPQLLEITRDSHPTLSEADEWFLDYLKSRIRPHLEDPKALLGSDLLDQISSILSPNKVLLRTVLEIFCERILVRPDFLSSITSPGSSRPNSPPPPPGSPMSVLQLRPKAILHDDLSPVRKKATPWPSPEQTSLASWSKEASPEPGLHQILTRDHDFKSETDIKSEPDVKSEPELKLELSPEPILAEPVLAEAEPEAAPTPVPEFATAVEPDDKKSEVNTWGPTSIIQTRERSDSGKVIDLEPELEATPVLKELDPIPEFEPDSKPRYERRLLREVDSGFWDFSPPEVEAVKEPTPSIAELGPEPDHVAQSSSDHMSEPLDKLERSTEPQEPEAVITRDFAVDDEDKEKGKSIDTEPETAKEHELASIPEVVTEDVSETVLESFPEPEQVVPEKDVTKGLEEDVEEDFPHKVQVESKEEVKEVEAQPETEKVEPMPNKPRAWSGLTGTQVSTAPIESEAEASEPKPEAEVSPKPELSLPDNSEPAEPAQPKTTEPSVEPRSEPAREPETAAVQPTDAATEPANTAAAKSVPVSGTEPAAKQEGAKADQDAVQACGTQARQRSWRRRLLRYPVLFGRGM